MKFNKLYKKITTESMLAGDGSVFGPGSVGGDYNPGDARIAKGTVSIYSRLPTRKKRKKAKK
jgi:hypothetical protein